MTNKTTLAVLDVPDELPQIADDIAGIKQLVLAIQAAADGVASDPGVQGIAALAAIIIDRIDALEHRIGLLREPKRRPQLDAARSSRA